MSTSTVLMSAACGALMGSLATYAWCRRAAPASSGKEGEEKKKRRRIMMRTSISKDKLEKYRRHHQGVWPEVERGLRAHGVTLLTIHEPADGGNLFNMYIETEPSVDLGRDLGPGSKYRDDARVAEWEELMSGMFETGSWEAMKEVYTLTPSSSTNSLPPDYPM